MVGSLSLRAGKGRGIGVIVDNPSCLSPASPWSTSSPFPSACVGERVGVRGLLFASTRSLQLLRDALGLREQQQVIRSTRFAIGPAHIEAAKRIDADICARCLAVKVQVAHMELSPRLLKMSAVTAEYGAG